MQIRISLGGQTGTSDLIFFKKILPEVSRELLSNRSIEMQFSTALNNVKLVHQFGDYHLKGDRL